MATPYCRVVRRLRETICKATHREVHRGCIQFVGCRSLLKTQLLKRFLGISTSGNGKVPWTALGKSQADYIKGKYLPKGLTLKQYYHCHRRVGGNCRLCSS